MREITTHRVNACNDQIDIRVLDEPGSGGANHQYLVLIGAEPSHALKKCGQGRMHVELNFQNGPIAEVGVNGITNEALLAIVIDRMEGFQRGPYASKKNADALGHLCIARDLLHERTRERMARGVEGTHAP